MSLDREFFKNYSHLCCHHLHPLPCSCSNQRHPQTLVADHLLIRLQRLYILIIEFINQHKQISQSIMSSLDYIFSYFSWIIWKLINTLFELNFYEYFSLAINPMDSYVIFHPIPLITISIKSLSLVIFFSVSFLIFNHLSALALIFNHLSAGRLGAVLGRTTSATDRPFSS